MGIQKPLTRVVNPSYDRPSTGRAIVSPCSICPHNFPVAHSEASFNAIHESNLVGYAPCPKKISYAEAATSEEGNKFVLNHPVYNSKYKGDNPVYFERSGRKYSYCYIAKIADNVDTGLNPEFDLTQIICSGPYLIEHTEKYLNQIESVEELDIIHYQDGLEMVDGITFNGFIRVAGTYHNNIGYRRERDRIVGKALSNGSL